jgi:CubicO group peptidase (beta-lactamase class C family)
MEAATGVDFLQIVAEEIVLPFGLLSFAADDVMAVVPDRVSGYFTARELDALAQRLPALAPLAANGRCANIGLSNPAFCWAGAGLIAHMPDLARFGAGLLDGPQARITAEERALLFTPLTDGATEQPALGLGWRVDADKHGRVRYHHAGSTPGGRCGLVIYPEQSLSIALASNTMITPGDVLGAASELADLFA